MKRDAHGQIDDFSEAAQPSLEDLQDIENHSALTVAAMITKARLEEEAIEALSEDDAEGTITYEDGEMVDVEITLTEGENDDEQTEE